MPDKEILPGTASAKEWSSEELSQERATYQAQYPDEWLAYLRSESELGFITNAMNGHIIGHLERQRPDLSSKGFGIGAVAFRFANERVFHFPMWQPENRARRSDEYWAYVREARPQLRGVRANGFAKWSAEDVTRLTAHLQENAPEFWANLCEVYNELGFSDVRMAFEFKRYVAELFAVPEDIDYHSAARFAVIEEANRLNPFEMLKPENKELSEALWREWDANPDHKSFDEWREQVRARNLRSKKTTF